jgi:carbamoyltransferase
MGLAPYGTARYVDQFRRMVHLGPNGTYALDLSWFEHHLTGKHRVSARFLKAFGSPRPRVAGPVEQHYADVAYALQKVLEETGLHIARWLQRESGQRNICVAGGVALNSVMNGRIMLETPFEHFFAPPAASDAGTALGAALHAARAMGDPTGPMETAALGPEWTDDEIRSYLDAAHVPFDEPADLADAVAEILAADGVVGWYQGRSEYGPRALGHRSLLADPRRADNLERLNDIKGREQFRPIAPMVLLDRAHQIFDGPVPSPYMLFTHRVDPAWAERIPAVVHVDGTARIQTVDPGAEPLVAAVLRAFERRTGVPVVVNTSFNTSGRPIVDSPRDALECFGAAPIDALAIGPALVRRSWPFARAGAGPGAATARPRGDAISGDG